MSNEMEFEKWAKTNLKLDLTRFPLKVTKAKAVVKALDKLDDLEYSELKWVNPELENWYFETSEALKQDEEIPDLPLLKNDEEVAYEEDPTDLPHDPTLSSSVLQEEQVQDEKTIKTVRLKKNGTPREKSGPKFGSTNKISSIFASPKDTVYKARRLLLEGGVRQSPHLLNILLMGRGVEEGELPKNGSYYNYSHSIKHCLRIMIDIARDKKMDGWSIVDMKQIIGERD